MDQAAICTYHWSRVNQCPCMLTLFHLGESLKSMKLYVNYMSYIKFHLLMNKRIQCGTLSLTAVFSLFVYA